jgi:hypothetical protein
MFGITQSYAFTTSPIGQVDVTWSSMKSDIYQIMDSDQQIGALLDDSGLAVANVSTTSSSKLESIDWIVTTIHPM